MIHRASVLDVNAEQGQFEVEMFAHPSKGTSTAPDDHHIRLIFDERTDVMSEPLNGVFLAHALNLFLGSLHEARRGWRPRFAIHTNFPFTLGIDRFVQIHHFSDGSS